MAKDASFDIVSEIDLQAIDDVVNTAMKEIQNRFDLKGTGSKIEFDRTKKTVTLTAPSDFQIKQCKDILKQKMAKRGISTKALTAKPIEKMGGDTVRELNDIVCGISQEVAKEIIRDIKDSKIKVQASIHEDKLRVSGKSKDDLQAVIALVRNKEYSIPLQFTNYR